MTDWQARRSLRIALAVVAGAIVVGLIAPGAAEAASTKGSSSHGTSNKDKNERSSTSAPAKQKTTGAPNKAAPQQTRPAPAPKPKSKKDKPPDRSPHKATPQQRTPVTKQAPGRHNNKPTPTQGFPNGRIAPPSPTQLQPWLPQQPKTKAPKAVHDLVYRFRIVNGQVVDRTADPLDTPDSDDILPSIPGLTDEDPSAPPVLRFPALVPGLRLPPTAKAPKTDLFVRGGKLPHARDLINSGTVTTGVRGGGRFPMSGVKPNEVLYRVNPQTGKITNYAVYDKTGMIIKRVDLEGAPHGGVQTPHVVDYKINQNPVTGKEYLGPVSKLPRPANPDEIP